jgi:hypothetical protein
MGHVIVTQTCSCFFPFLVERFLFIGTFAVYILFKTKVVSTGKKRVHLRSYNVF